MKKIVSMLTVGALTLGCLFADVSLGFTGKAVIVGENGNLNLKGYRKDLTGDAEITENIKFSAKNDYAGVYFEVKPNAAKIDKNNFGGKLSQYYGWMNFGNLQIMAGIWDKRSVARMTDEADKWEGNHYETYKPGVINGVDGEKDSFHMTDKRLATQFTYTAGFGSVAGAIVSNDGYNADGSGTKITSYSGFAFEGKFNLSNGNLLVVLKNHTHGNTSFAASVNIKNDKMNAMGAVTWATGNKIGVDLRARIPFGDGFMLTTMNNLSKNGTLKLWDMFSVSYNVADNVKAMATLEFENGNLGKNDDDNLIRIIPSVKYSVSKKSYATTGVIIELKNLCFAGCETAHTPFASKVAVPLILHVEM